MVESNADRSVGIAAWSDTVRAVFHKPALVDLVMQEIDSSDTNKPLRLLLIGSFYYGAVAAGLVKRGVTAYSYLPGRDVYDAFIKLRDAEESKSQDIANVIRLVTLFDLLFGAANLDRVTCMFARDWKLDDKDFRTTWTAGWWLERVVELRLHSVSGASFESQLVQQVLTAATAASHDGSVDMLAFAMHEMPSGLKQINLADATGKSALMIATEQGDVGAVRVLLAAGADRRLKDRDGHTPLMVATRRKNEEVIAEFKRADGVLHNIAPGLEEQHERISSLVLDLGTGEMKLLAYTQSPQTEVPTAIVAVPSCRPHLFHLL